MSASSRAATSRAVAGALPRGGRQPVRELARAHRVHPAPLGDMAQDRVGRNDRHLAVGWCGRQAARSPCRPSRCRSVSPECARSRSSRPCPSNTTHRRRSRPGPRSRTTSADSSSRARSYSSLPPRRWQTLSPSMIQSSAQPPRCRTASNSSTAAAVDTFSDSTLPRIGIATAWSQTSRTRRPQPAALGAEHEHRAVAVVGAVVGERRRRPPRRSSRAPAAAPRAAGRPGSRPARSAGARPPRPTPGTPPASRRPTGGR